MGPYCTVIVAVVVIYVVMAEFGMGRSSLKEAESSSWNFLLNSRAILRPIVSDYFSSAIFLSVLHSTVFIVSSQ